MIDTAPRVAFGTGPPTDLRLPIVTTGRADHSAQQATRPPTPTTCESVEQPLTSKNDFARRPGLEQGLRVMYLMTLMTLGLYTPPEGAYLPAVLY